MFLFWADKDNRIDRMLKNTHLHGHFSPPTEALLKNLVVARIPKHTVKRIAEEAAAWLLDRPDDA